MAWNSKALRGGAVLLGVGAILAAAATPGAVAQSSGQAQANITRAALIQANAANTEVDRGTLVTQVQIDGQGEVNFTVPVVEGSAPSNMDSFGGPTVENGQAVYDLTADGPESFRTAQDFPTDDVPVDLRVTAKLDGKPIDLSELSGVTGEVELAYTAKNLTSTPATLTYEDGSGAPVEEDVDLVTSMGGTLEITFPSSWSNISSKDATVVSGDGDGSTLVSGSFTLMEPFGTPEQTFTISANVTNGNMPPAVLQFTVLEPQNNPTARSIAESLKGGVASGQSIFDAGSQLKDGAGQLIDGLTSASEGAVQLADGVSNTLQPGVNELNSAVQSSLAPGVQQLVAELANLPATVTSSPEFAVVTGGFALLDGAVGGVRNSLGVFSSNGPGQYLTAAGEIDKSRTTVARTIWSLIYGVRAQDVPADSPGKTPVDSTGGLTNPACDPSTPQGIQSPTNPCGAFQIAGNINKITGGTAQALTDQIKPGLIGGLQALGCTVNGTDVTGCPGPTGPTADGAFTASLTGIYGPTGVAAQLGLANALGTGLLPKLTSDPTGNPDPNTKNGNTATGILNELRAALALGGVGSSGVPGTCAAFRTPGDPASGLNPQTTQAQIAATCSAADVLTVSLLVSDTLETGISTTLLQGISASLVAGVQPLAVGVDELADGTQQLADGVVPLAEGTAALAAGLPSAVDGAGKIKTDAAGGLQEAGNSAAADFGRRVALFEAMNDPELVSKYIPGGAPEGDNITYNGVYKYELAGVGSQTNTTATLALSVLGLAGAAGVGAFAASRRAAG